MTTMPEPPLQARCAELQVPVRDIATWGVKSSIIPGDVTELKPLISAVESVLAQGTEGITSPRYLGWHASASATLAKMRDAVEDDDGKRAWALFSDPKTGFYELGQACQGCEGW